MRYFEYAVELEAMRAFYNEIAYPEGSVDYSCNTDGRIILDENTWLLGSLNEFKVIRKNNEDVFNHMKRYIKAYNARALSLPKYGVYIITSEQKYTVFDLEADKVENAIVVENLDLTIDPNDFSCSADAYLKDTTTQKGWIDETSIVSFNDLYFGLKGKSKKKKDDFIAELANPTILNIKPYTWNESGSMERKLLDCLGSSELKKRLGAFFTPDYAVEKSTTYLRNIISQLPDDYLIIDRCAGTGNLEKFLTDEELSHCILNTINYAELTTLKGLYEGRVRAILPIDETTDEDGCMSAGDALEEQFNNNLINLINAEKAKNPNLTVIMLENPPYVEPQAEATRSGKTLHGTSNNYITDLMTNVKGAAKNDMANKFIWSAFNLIKTDYYVVYSPVKYFKSQNLVNKKFIEGCLVNRKDFHATEAGISLMVWKNEDEVVDSWQLENCLIKRVKSGSLFSTILTASSNEICKFHDYSGSPDFKHGTLGNEKPKGHIATKVLTDSNIKQALPLFAANCYVCKDFTEKEVIMKSGDGGTAYLQDNEFLEDCFLWCCLTDKNKCWSSGNVINEMAISQNSKADQLIDLKSSHRLNLKRKWDLVLNEAQKCKEYNSKFKYGLAQIINDLNLSDETNIVNKKGEKETVKRYPKLDEQIKSLKSELKTFYDTYIAPKCFQYELLK